MSRRPAPSEQAQQRRAQAPRAELRCEHARHGVDARIGKVRGRLLDGASHRTEQPIRRADGTDEKGGDGRVYDRVGLREGDEVLNNALSRHLVEPGVFNDAHDSGARRARVDDPQALADGVLSGPIEAGHRFVHHRYPLRSRDVSGQQAAPATYRGPHRPEVVWRDRLHVRSPARRSGERIQARDKERHGERPTKWIPGREARSTHARQLLDAVPHLLIQGVDGGALVAKPLQVHRGHDQPVGVESQPQTLHMAQAADEQPRARQQDQCERDLAHEQTGT